MANFEEVLAYKNALSNKFVGTNISDLIHSVGVGYEDLKGWFLRIYVNDLKKGNLTTIRRVISPHIAFPSTFEVQIVESLLPTFCASPPPPIYGKFMNPMVGGISVSRESDEFGYGTLGYFCYLKNDSSKQVYLLSCNHVFAFFDFDDSYKIDENAGSEIEGDTTPEKILQAGKGESGNQNDEKLVASLYKSVKLFSYPHSNKANRVDASIAKLKKISGHTVIKHPKLEIYKIGKVIGTISHSNPENLRNLEVCKHGRGSGLTNGSIYDYSLDTSLLYEYDMNVSLKFVDQLLIKPLNNDFVKAGDSGSLVVSKPHKKTCKAIGLLFARTVVNDVNVTPNMYMGLVNPIDFVLSELDIDLIM